MNDDMHRYGALRLSYRSRFVGQDQISVEGPERAFISNYQKVALVRGDNVALLGPRRDVKGLIPLERQG